MDEKKIAKMMNRRIAVKKWVSLPLPLMNIICKWVRTESIIGKMNGKAMVLNDQEVTP